MSILKLLPHLSEEELRDRMSKEKELRFFKQWQLLYAIASHRGMKAAAIALMLGSSISIVRRTVQLYNKGGAGYMEQLKWGGRRKERCMMSREEEKQLLQQARSTALRGEVLVAKSLRPLVEQKTGVAVSDDYLFDLLHRHGWTKKAPRPQHPKKDQQSAQRFKKKQ